MPPTSRLLLALTLCGIVQASPADESQTPLAQHSHLRRPVAAAWLDGGRTLAVVNQHSGSVSLIDADFLTITTELPVARRLSDLAALPDGRLLATDDQAHELLLLAREHESLTPAARLPVPAYPIRVAASEDGRRAFVASLWSRRVSVVGVPPAADPAPRVLHSVRLPFAPRELLPLPNEKLLVADAFRGEVAVIDAAAGEIAVRHTLPVQTIRGLALTHDARRVLVSCQALDESAPTTWDSIDLGRLVRSEIRVLPLDQLLDPSADLNAGAEIIPIGSIGRGAGDPAAVAALDDGRWLVALAGVNEAAVGSDDGVETRLAAGDRPTAVLPAPDGRRAFVLNTFSDSVSVIDLTRPAVTDEIALGPSPLPGPVERGERLFYDARLSHDGWMSCHSCHADGHSTDGLVDTLGDGTYGTPKRILSLLGTGTSDPWAWNGQIKELHTQVERSVESTMRGPRVTSAQVNDLVAYLHSLPPAPPTDPEPASDADRQGLARGRALFESRGCAQCHVPPLTYTSHAAYDVGLPDEAGRREFNPPPLRGVSQRARLLHDGRAKTLEEVLTDHAHPSGEAIPEADVADLVRYLRSL